MKRVTHVKLLFILLCNLIVFNNVLASEKKVFYAGFSFSVGSFLVKKGTETSYGIDVINFLVLKL